MKESFDQFVKDTVDCSRDQDLFDRFVAYLEQTYQVDLISYHLLSTNLQAFARADHPIFHTFPDEWVKVYLNDDKFEIDPIIKLARTQGAPFHWFDVSKYLSLSDEQKRYLNELKNEGFVDGLAVPLFGPQHEIGYIGIGSTKRKLELNEADLDMIHHACYQFHNRYREMVDREQQKERPKLSPREREVLHWVALGKSNSVIADILEISEHTVDTLLRRSYHKLDVSNRIGAVLKGVGYGIIHPA